MRTITVLLALALTACSGPRPDHGVPTSRWGEDAMSWAPCPDDLGGPEVACTLLDVPIDWSAPGDGTFGVLIRRLPGRGDTGRNLWALDGGPGFAGDAFLDPAFSQRVTSAGLDLYVVSHRGSIGPSALYCPKSQAPDSPEGGMVTQAEWPGCIAEWRARWGDDLTAFTSRAAARDVAHAMRRVGPATRNLVFGGSYGSLWAHRLLLDTDAPVDAALLDSVVPIGASLEAVDAQADAAMRHLLRACADQPECADAFGRDPLTSAEDTLARYATGEGCGQREGLMDAKTLRARVRAGLDGAPRHWRDALTLLAMLERCALADLTALSTPPALPSALGTPPRPPRYNAMLNRHLVFRELYRHGPPSPDAATWLTASEASSSVAAIATHFGPDYRRVDPPLRPTSAVPTTLLSGRLDPLDRPAWAQAFADTLDHADLHVLPWAGHSTLRYLGLGPDGCGTRILSTFLAAGAPDTSCVASVATPSLAITLP